MFDSPQDKALAALLEKEEAATLSGYQDRQPVKPCQPVTPPAITRAVRRSTMTPEQQAAHSLACAASTIAASAARKVKAAQDRRREQKRRSAIKNR